MEAQKGSSDGEDIPSDFFDDFAKEEFIEGLSVIDSWDDSDKKNRALRSRICAEDIDKVEDLRDLIEREAKDDDRIIRFDRKYKWTRKEHRSSSNTSVNQRQSSSTSHLDNYIKPGSRRDINKTNEAIKRDKEEKVKEYLAKHLESTDDLRPPGTELDDFFEGKKFEAKKLPSESKSNIASPPKQRPVFVTKKRRESPTKRRESPRFRRQQWSPRRQQVAVHSPRRSPRRYSPRRLSPRRSSPRRLSARRLSPSRNIRRSFRSSPRRLSPVLRRRKSRSPIKHVFRRSRSRSPHFKDRAIRRHSRSRSRSRDHRAEEDDFLYPKNYYPPVKYSSAKNDDLYTSAQPGQHYTEPMTVESPGVAPSFPYSQGVPYSAYGVPYGYGSQPAPPLVMPVPQPVPAPIPIQGAPLDTTNVAPAMVPPPQQMTAHSNTLQIPANADKPPADALAKLVADGKLSHEDYLKLAPNKGACQVMDTHARVAALNRCNSALSKLGNIVLPNRLLVNTKMLPYGMDQKQIAPKYCSPLKRQDTTEFHFSKSDASLTVHRNKQIIETLITTLGLENLIVRPKKRMQKDTKDVAVQTVKPFCDVCEIRASMQFSETGTSIDHECISTSVHTQVLEQDLFSSKSVFNPSGSVADGAPMSIAHMTPAQLVSQLAARAKTLKQSDPVQTPSQFRKPQNSYDYDYDRRGGGSNQFNSNNYNYRY